VSTILRVFSDLSPFLGLELMITPLNQEGFLLFDNIKLFGVHCGCCCVTNQRPEGRTILSGIL
jgi:hypothetical protein